MNKRLAIFFFIVALSFMIDSTITYFLPHDFSKTEMLIIPHIGLMMWTLYNNIVDDGNRYFFACLVGVYFAVIYVDSLLIYVLLYCLYAFFGRKYMKLSEFSLFEALAVVSLTIFVQESVLYWLMWITNVTVVSVITFVLQRLLPTYIFNIVLLVPLFYIHKKLRFEGKKDGY